MGMVKKGQVAEQAEKWSTFANGVYLIQEAEHTWSQRGNANTGLGKKTMKEHLNKVYMIQEAPMTVALV